MRVLITGAAGFVGIHVYKALQGLRDSAAIIGTSREKVIHPVIGEVEALDVTDESAVAAALARHRPTHVIHLAAIAALDAAHAAPQDAWRVHVGGTLNIARGILNVVPECFLLNVGSGLVYGESAKAGCPIDEHTLPAPVDEYAAAKAAADLALGALVHRGLKCLRLRPFNHTGPGQTTAFAVPAFAMQIAQIEAGLADPILSVGNLDAERDFLDVRDVVDAYVRAVVRAKDLPSGVILNIASGRTWRIGDLLNLLLAKSTKEIDVKQDLARMRPSDLPRIVGDASRARTMLEWTPRYTMEETLSAVLDDCRARVVTMEDLSP